MSKQQDFIKAGFSVIQNENTENKLLQFLKEHYPQTIVGNELKINELKAILGIPFDEKVSGYGLNFVGRNVARAKYGQPTQKEVLLNPTLSHNADTTQNLVLKGDNLDSLKILKNHYTGKIKCIYIDPPYNTGSDEFVYPDKFDREEAQALGIADSLSDEDFLRMEFSFETKKNHNGWLTFMYPRLLLARDLLSKDGVIFISIDDNEQANLKILCDEIFGEENFVGNIVWQKKTQPSFLSKEVSTIKEYILFYKKSDIQIRTFGGYTDPNKNIELLNISNTETIRFFKKENILIENGKFSGTLQKGIYGNEPLQVELLDDIEIFEGKPNQDFSLKGRFKWGQEKIDIALKEGDIFHLKSIKTLRPTIEKVEKVIGIKPILDLLTKKIDDNIPTNTDASKELDILFSKKEIFSNPKPSGLVKYLLNSITYDNSSEHIILDFFAGSGTTGHAVMALNAEDGGNRKFILCQIDEPIAENKPAYQFCMDNALPPFISSITIERLKRAGEQIGSGDTGFKVFDHTPKPELQEQDGTLFFPEIHTDTLSRIYSMVFGVGIDEPTQVPEVVIPDSVYRIEQNYYIINSDKISQEEMANIIKQAKRVYIDGWTASLNTAIQSYKEDIKIVF